MFRREKKVASRAVLIAGLSPKAVTGKRHDDPVHMHVIFAPLPANCGAAFSTHFHFQFWLDRRCICRNLVISRVLLLSSRQH